MSNSYRLYTASHGEGASYENKHEAERHATWLSHKLGERVWIRHNGELIGSVLAAAESEFSYTTEAS